MAKKIGIHGIFVFVILLLCSATVWGQANTSLRGTVADPSGAVVPKAQLIADKRGDGLGAQGRNQG